MSMDGSSTQRPKGRRGLSEPSHNNTQSAASVLFTPADIKAALLSRRKSFSRFRGISRSHHFQASLEDVLRCGAATIEKVASAHVLSPGQPFSFLPHVLEEFASIGISQFICELASAGCIVPQEGSPLEVSSTKKQMDEILADVLEEGSPTSSSSVLPCQDGGGLAQGGQNDLQSSASGSSCGGQADKQLISMEGHMRGGLTKDVPPEFVYAIRGVRCWECLRVFRHPDAVNVLVDHIREAHPKIATGAHLSKVRRDNSVEKVLRKGMQFCKCEYCTTVKWPRMKASWKKK